MVERRLCEAVSIINVVENLCRVETPAAPGVAYYRSRNVARGQTIEYLAVGNYPIIETAWDRFTGGDAGAALDGLSILDSNEYVYSGYLSYEAGYAFEKRWYGLARPEAGYAHRFYQIPCWYERNLDTGVAEICWTQGCKGDELAELRRLLERFGSSTFSSDNRSGDVRQIGSDVAHWGELSEFEYCALIERAKEDIRAGRFYELNFTQRFRRRSCLNPVEVFRRILSDLAPVQAFLGVFPDEVICSASPEVFLQKYGKDIVTRPIKGSYVGQVQDQEKLHAEHTMVVDLARNDLGRLSDLAPVSVADFMNVEAFGHHHHYVSTVKGRTSKGVMDILRATFPAASITGAPKVEVVTAIGELEKTRRGIYTGTCGWVGPDGDMDLNVAIRTFSARADGDGWMYELGSGGAIVADSDPGQEYQECLMKAYPLLSVLR